MFWIDLKMSGAIAASTSNCWFPVSSNESSGRTGEHYLAPSAEYTGVSATAVRIKVVDRKRAIPQQLVLHKTSDHVVQQCQTRQCNAFREGVIFRLVIFRLCGRPGVTKLNSYERREDRGQLTPPDLPTSNYMHFQGISGPPSHSRTLTIQ